MGGGRGSAPLHPRSMHHSLSQEGPRQPAPALSLPHSKQSQYICQDVFKLICSSNIGKAFHNLSFRSKMEALHFLGFSLVAPLLENSWSKILDWQEAVELWSCEILIPSTGSSGQGATPSPLSAIISDNLPLPTMADNTLPLGWLIPRKEKGFSYFWSCPQVFFSSYC